MASSSLISKISDSFFRLEEFFNSSLNHTDISIGLQAHEPQSLELHYITNNLISIALPVENAHRERGSGFDFSQLTTDESDSDSLSLAISAGGPLHKRDPSISSYKSLAQSPSLADKKLLDDFTGKHSDSPFSAKDLYRIQKVTASNKGPARLSAFLSRNHSSHFLLFNLSGKRSSLKMAASFKNQIIDLPWSCVGENTAPIANIPTLRCLLDTCYAIDSYLKLCTKHTAALCCSDGFQRTGIALAAYLRYSGQAASTLHGYGIVCDRRFPHLQSDQFLTPTLKTIFANFDNFLDCRSYIQKDPMILRAITVQGIPVESMPRLDIWDAHGRIYSSHPPRTDMASLESPSISPSNSTIENISKNKEINLHATTGNKDVVSSTCSSSADTAEDVQKISSENELSMETVNKNIWMGGEGFFRVNTVISGDFLLICRFGGPYAHDTEDSTKILFRYANSTGFMFPGPWVLPRTKIDIMKIYASSLDSDEFSVSLIFDPVEGNVCSNRNIDDTSNDERYTEKVNGVINGKDAILLGVNLLCEHHCGRSAIATPFDTQSGYDVRLCREPAHETCSRLQDSLRLFSLLLNNSNPEEADRKMNDYMNNLSVLDNATRNFDSARQLNANVTGDTKVNVREELIHFVNNLQLGDTVDVNSCHRPYLALRSTQCPEYSAQSFLVEYKPFFHAQRGEVVNALKSDGRLCDLTASLVWKDSMNDKRHELHSSQSSHRKTHSNDWGMSTFPHPYSSQAEPILAIVDNSCESINGNNLERQKILKSAVPRTITVQIGDKDEFKSTVAADQGDVSYFNEPNNRSINNRKSAPDESGDCGEIDTKPDCSPFQMSIDDQVHVSVVAKPDTQTYKTGTVEAELGASIPVMVNGTSNNQGKIIGRSSGYYTVQIPAHVISNGHLIITEKTEAAAAADSAAFANTINREGKTFVPWTGPSVRKIKGRKLIGHMAATAAAIIAQAKSSKIENETTDRPALKDDPEYTKYFRMFKMGLSHEAVRHALRRDGKDPNIMEQDHSQPAPALIALKNDPEFQPYFAMIASGSDKDDVKSQMLTEGKNPYILDLNPEIPLPLQSLPEPIVDEMGELPLKDDPIFAKYFRMLRMGMAKEIARHALQRDGKDPRILDLDPLKTLSSQTVLESEGGAGISWNQSGTLNVALKKEMRRRKIKIPTTFNQPDRGDDIRANLARAIVNHARSKNRKNSADDIILHEKENISIENDDGYNPTSLETKEVSRASQQQSNNTKDEGQDVPLKDSPEYAKYFKMMKMGLPKDAVRNALVRDGKDPKIADYDGEKSLASQQQSNNTKDESQEVPLKDSPEYAKYFKMMKMGLPKDAVRNALVRDGKDPKIADYDGEKSLASQQQSNNTKDESQEVPLKDSPEYAKYFKMMKMGLPKDAVRNALVRDGKDPKIADYDGEKSLASQQQSNNTKDESQEVPLKDSPEYAKYFKMMKMGLPKDAVRNALVRDGKDPKIADYDGEKSLASQQQSNNTKDESQEVPLKDSPEYAKYFKMMKMGLPKDAVRNALVRDGKDPKIADYDGEKSLASQQQSNNTKDESQEVPLKDSPEYAKYFKMMKMGLPKDAVRNALVRDGKDPKIADYDGEKSLASQQQSNNTKDESQEVPLKDSPEYAKYFKMMKMGLPKDAVRNALVRDGKDPKIADYDGEKSLASQQQSNNTKDESQEVPLKDSPEYAKYFKMMKMGLPKDAVRNALVRDGKDPKIADYDGEKSLASQQQSNNTKDESQEVPLKDSPEYAKYFKMMKMGLPKDAVRNALVRDGKDPKIADYDGEKSLASQQQSNNTKDESQEVPLKDSPEYAKYFKMMKMGLPKDAVRNALVRDGKDPKIADYDGEKSLASQQQSNNTKDESQEVPLKDSPEYAKYFKMMKMGLPKDAVRNALVRDGKDPKIADYDGEKSLASQQQSNNTKDESQEVPLKDSPEYAKYFKMMKMGLPKDAVRNALVRDGKDPKIADYDGEKSLASQDGISLQSPSDKNLSISLPSIEAPQVFKIPIRRKKIYWNALDHSKIIPGSMWEQVVGMVDMKSLIYDSTEFETLFTEPINNMKNKLNIPADNEKSAVDNTKPKKSVQVIEGKRGMNGGIALARIKKKYDEVASIIDQMVIGIFDMTQLKSLREYLPSQDERTGLQLYLDRASVSDESKKVAVDSLCECEKYMVAMMGVENALEKFDCLLFESHFDSRVRDIRDSVELLTKASDEIRSSARLMKLLAMVLTLGNYINTGESKGSGGFMIDALLELDKAKAFDKKTSVLQYLVRLVKQNDESLLKVKEDLLYVERAQNLTIDSISNELVVVVEELKRVKETTNKHGVGTSENQNGKDENSNGSVSLITSEHMRHTSMETFVQSASKQIDEVSSAMVDLKSRYRSLLEYFGEDLSKKSSDFFGTFSKFLNHFHGAIQLVENQEKAKIMAEKRAAKGVSPIPRVKKSITVSNKQKDEAINMINDGSTNVVKEAGDKAVSDIRNDEDTKTIGDGDTYRVKKAGCETLSDLQGVEAIKTIDDEGTHGTKEAGGETVSNLQEKEAIKTIDNGTIHQMKRAGVPTIDEGGTYQDRTLSVQEEENIKTIDDGDQSPCSILSEVNAATETKSTQKSIIRFLSVPVTAHAAEMRPIQDIAPKSENASNIHRAAPQDRGDAAPIIGRNSIAALAAEAARKKIQKAK